VYYGPGVYASSVEPITEPKGEYRAGNMVLAAMTAVAICVTPSPTPTQLSTPPPLIIRVRASLLCSGLRERIAPSVAGLSVNDKIISQGQLMMAKLRADAITDPRGDSGVGGASSSSEMDDFQMTSLVQALSKNLRRIEAMLNDPAIFPARARNDDEEALDNAKYELEVVATYQRQILNILSTTLESNKANDLLSKCDPVDCPGGGPTPPRLSLPKALAAAVQTELRVELDVAPAGLMTCAEFALPKRRDSVAKAAVEEKDVAAMRQWVVGTRSGSRLQHPAGNARSRAGAHRRKGCEPDVVRSARCVDGRLVCRQPARSLPRRAGRR
jgi:hypothetical protein